MRGSGQRLPITLRFTRVLGTFSHTTCFPFSCALWACFSDRSVSGERSEPMGALMPHAALWVVQQAGEHPAVRASDVSIPHAAIPFRPHHRFAVPLPRSRRGGLVTRRFLAESRNISFPRRCGGSGERSEPMGALMPHAALWVVQLWCESIETQGFLGFQCRTRLCGWCSRRCSRSIMGMTVRFNAARGFVGGATEGPHLLPARHCVSMPHAALWVVQPYRLKKFVAVGARFQCRTRLFPFAPTTASRSPSPAHAGEAWLRTVFSQNHAISASPADAGERSTSANHTSFYSCSWDVFPYDLFPVQLCPMGLLLGQVSKWRAQRADRGAHTARGFVGGAA